jgi:transketolase
MENIKKFKKLAADTIRILAAEGVQKANSGHPGMPMGMADCAFVLWAEFLKFNPKDPEWVNRDRFVLSAGHGSMLLYSLLHLSGFDVTLEDLNSFRQWGSRTPGHPEYGYLPGVETTTGPLGQGFANGVGMAIAAKMHSARYNTTDFNLFGSHLIYGIVSDGDMMEGVASEAASLAGHLGLGNIVYIYDDNNITIDGNTNLAFTEDVAKRFDAYGWHTIKIDGHDHDQITNAIEIGKNEKEKPTLILAKTHIGYGSPNKQDTSGVHGSPLGDDELIAMKENLGWPSEESFYIPNEVQEIFNNRVKDLRAEYEEWQKQFNQWQTKEPELSQKFSNAYKKSIPESLFQDLVQEIAEETGATRSLSGKAIQKVAEIMPGFVGGSADLAPSNNTYIKSENAISKSDFSGKNFHFGIREHSMGSIMNGVALYGGYIPYGGTFLVFSDYMRPSIRLAALMGIQSIYVFTHDSIFLGEDGPTHQPVEQLASLRTIPNLNVLRPADNVEVAASWVVALENQIGPTALILTRQKVQNLNREETFKNEDVKKGAYIISKENNEHPEIIIVASGSEVQLAMESKKLLEEDNIATRVISMLSLEIFKQQPNEYKHELLSKKAKAIIVIEAGVTFGWKAISYLPMLVIGIDRFGASAPLNTLAEKFGFTPERVCEKINEFLKKL